MAKFGKSITTEEEEIAPAPVVPPVTVVDQQTVQMASVQAIAQADASVGLAEISLDTKIVENQLEKEDEHWMKHFWRPAMGWLYMLICFMDFVVFPSISIFTPIITKMPYIAWQSLTLSNGGLIHMAFGAILGVAAYGRTQEKVNKAQ